MIRTNLNTLEKLEHLTPVQIAGLTQTSLKSVYKWIRSGQLTAEKTGAKWTIKRKDLDIFLQRRRLNSVIASTEKRDHNRGKH